MAEPSADKPDYKTQLMADVQTVLYFPTSVKPLLTPFRKEAVTVIAELVFHHLQGRLRSWSVASWQVPGEDDSWRLVVEAAADLDWDALAEIRRTILKDLANAARPWTPAERSDFSKLIYLELQPAEPQ